MTEEIPIDELDDMLTKLLGAKIMVVHERTGKDDVEGAMRARGETKAYTMLQGMLDHYKEHGEWPGDTDSDLWEQYYQVGSGALKSNDEVDGRNEDPTISVH